MGNGPNDWRFKNRLQSGWRDNLANLYGTDHIQPRWHYTVTYRLADIAGNEEIAKTLSFKLDMKAPTIEVAIPGAVSIYENSSNLTPLITTIDTASGADNSKTTVVLNDFVLSSGVYSSPLSAWCCCCRLTHWPGNSTKDYFRGGELH